MMKKTVLMVMLLVVGLFMTTSNAMANQVTFYMDQLLDWGTLYNNQGGTWVPTAATNPLGQPTTQTFVDGTASPEYGNNQNDSYGILNVTRIADTTAGSYLFREQDSTDQLLVVFSGLSDVAIDTVASGQTIYSQGGSIALYSVPNGDYDTFALSADQFTTYTANIASAGTLLLTLAPQTIIDPVTNVAYTLKNNFNFAALAGSANGMLLDVTGGAWADLYDTNLKPNGSDLQFNFSSYPIGYDDNNIPTTYRGWVVTGVANAQGNVVPEPASMILMGLGLLGARLRRRKA